MTARRLSIRLTRANTPINLALGLETLCWLCVVTVCGAVWLLACRPFGVSAQDNNTTSLVYAQRGPYIVGMITTVLADDNHPLPVTIWYPALSNAGLPQMVTNYEDYLTQVFVAPMGAQAITNASPDDSGGPYPLVIWSHGMGDNRFGSVYLMEHLASYGFVVIAADHLRGPPLARYQYLVQYPRDLDRIISYAEILNGPNSMLAEQIDTEHIVVGGHSFGGYAALVAGGAQLNLDEYSSWCQSLDWRTTAYRECNYVFSIMWGLAVAAGYSSPPDGVWPPIIDAQADAVLAFAPGTAVFGQSGLKNVDVPVLFMVGSADEVLPSEQHAQPTYDTLDSEQRMLVTIEGAGHQVFTNACNEVTGLTAEVDILCSDSLVDVTRTHDLIKHVSTAFLLATVFGDEDATKACVSEAMIGGSSIQYETTLGEQIQTVRVD